MQEVTGSVRNRAAAIVALVLVSATAAHAQEAKPAEHPKVCANGIKDYYSRADLPAVFDSLTMPPSEPIRVTSEEEAMAAQNKTRALAGSIGATGLLTEEVRDENDGMVRIHRNLVPIFAVSDTARAYAECKKKF